MSNISIPRLDLGGRTGDHDDRRALGERLCDVYHDIGFAVVEDHGVDASVIAGVFEVMERFFALSDDDKRTIDKRASRHFRGWESVGTEYTNNRPDFREQIDLWTEHPPLEPDVVPEYLRLLGPNQWVADDVVPGFRAALERWFTAMQAVADDLLRLFSLGLGLPENDLTDRFGTTTMSLTKLISYPPTPQGAAGVNAHHDAGFLTLLAAGSTPGLEVRTPDGAWIAVPIVDNGLVLNIGEMMQAVTGNYLVATAHRVITDRPRLSAAYFHGPSLDFPLRPLALADRFVDAVAASERHRAAGFMATREQTDEGVADMASTTTATTYGEQLWNYFSRSYPELVRLHAGASATRTDDPR